MSAIKEQMEMSKAEKSLKAIDSCIQLYHSSCKSMSLDVLQTTMDSILNNIYFLSEELANAHRDYNQVYVLRKINAGIKTIDLKDKEKMSISQASTIADIESKSDRMEEIDYEAKALKLDLIIKSARNVANSIQSRINLLKAEKRETDPNFNFKK